MRKGKFLSNLLLLLWSSTLFAGEADVIEVKISEYGNNLYRFTVAVIHQDTGWKHYANKWEVIDEDGTILGTRTLLHPHVDEQPFSRNLTGVEIPDSIKTITVRAHDNVHGYGGKVFSVVLP